MKSLAMKIFFVLFLSSSFLIEITLEKKHKKRFHKKHLVVDNNAHPLSLHQVVRRTPTVTYGEASARIASSNSAASSSVGFSNSNSHNGETSFGKTATIVNPSVILHSTGSISAIKETPAHVGWRDEKKIVTSLNKHSGKVEQHEIKSRTPLIGMVQEVKNLKVNHSRKYDISNNSLGPISTSISE